MLALECVVEWGDVGMSVSRRELVAYLDDYLSVARYRDYCPNGLQVEGAESVAKIATGVTACQGLLDAAVDWGADAVLVHHGYFWRGEPQPVAGMMRRRLQTLLQNNLNLLAYHLPLDAHPEVGNNAQLGVRMGIPLAAHEPLVPGDPANVGNIASVAPERTAEQWLDQLERLTARRGLLVDGVQGAVSRIAWCTGGAQGYIDKAIAAGAELFVTGEVSEQTVHSAREEGIAFIAAGHHATERYGVQALGEHLAERFQVEHRYFEIDNPA